MQKLSYFQKQLLLKHFTEAHDILLTNDDFKHIDAVICSQNSGKPLVSGSLPLAQSRCCGRCDGINDVCVSDMICEIHGEQGCEVCFGKRQ